MKKVSSIWEKILERITVYIVCAFLLFMFCASILKLDWSTPLYGATLEAKKPEYSFMAVAEGSYQSQYEKWYNENFALRSYVLKTYNQFKYSFFNKSANDTITIGKSNVLYSKGYIDDWLKLREPESFEHYDAFAKDIKLLQDELLKQNKILCYIISPSKPEIYPEYLPDKYKMLGKYKTGENAHELLIRALKENNVNYYDTTDTMLRIKEAGYDSFPSTGVHWSDFSAGVAAGEIFQYVNKISEEQNVAGIHLQPGEMKVIEKTDPTGTDRDIYTLLNIYKGTISGKFYDIDVSYPIAEKEKVDVLYFGTSFGHEFKEATGSRAFRRIVRYNYLEYKSEETNEKEEKDENTQLDGDIHTSGALEELDQAKIIFLETTTLVPLPNSHLVFAKEAAKYVQDKNNNNHQ